MARQGGRQRGTPNKKTQELMDLSEELGVNPFEILLLVAGNKWEELGYVGPTTILLSKEGNEIEVDRINITERRQAAKDACQYIYPKRKAVEHTGENGKPLFPALSKQDIRDAILNDPFGPSEDEPADET